MTAVTLGGTTHPIAATDTAAQSDAWRIAALSLLSVRFVQGFIYWGGGSRRFIYAPAKLDPHAANWMANKFQSAMPGALLGTDRIIAFLLNHFDLLYASLILFSGAELIAGVFLMAGFLTQAAASISIGFSIALMLMFGWQGATCVDEWTMAASNLAMGATLMLAGGGAFSIDNALLRRWPALAGRGWFCWAGGALPLPLPDRSFRTLALAVFATTIVFNVTTYNHYRGSVFTAYHGGPVSPTQHHLELADGTVLPDGSVRFRAYLNGGTPATPSNIMAAMLTARDGSVLEQWDGTALSHLSPSQIANEFAYNRFAPGPFGLSAKIGAQATITLPGMANYKAEPDTPGKAATLRLRTVNGNSFEVPVQPGSAQHASKAWPPADPE